MDGVIGFVLNRDSDAVYKQQELKYASCCLFLSFGCHVIIRVRSLQAVQVGVGSLEVVQSVGEIKAWITKQFEGARVHAYKRCGASKTVLKGHRARRAKNLGDFLDLILNHEM